jgi:hypothetical protein
MELEHLFSICWMVTCISIAIPLFKIIYNNSHNKPIVAITIIDLVYSDCIIFLFCFCFFSAIDVSACLLSETKTLSFSLSLTLGVATAALFGNSLWSLTITGTLRFILIIKNSEQAEIQFQGPDYIAIWKIRLISIVLSSCFILSNHIFFDILPTFFYTLQYEKAIPKTFNSLHKISWIPSVLVILANAVPKLYTAFLKQHLFSDIPERYALSLEISLSFPVFILVAIASQFTTRINSLIYYDPLLIMLGCNVIPLVVIMQNKNMRQHIIEQTYQFLLHIHVLCKKCTTISVSPAICETLNVDNELHI